MKRPASWSRERAIQPLQSGQTTQPGSNRVFDMIPRTHPLLDILTDLIHMVERQRPEMLCAVLLQRNGRIYPAAGPSLPESFGRADAGLLLDLAARPHRAASSEDALSASDVANSPLWNQYRERALRHGLPSVWPIPIYSDGATLAGIFVIHYRDPRSPTDDELQLARMASRLAAIAIEQQELADQLAYQAQHDPLTSLPNRVLFEDRLHQAIAQAQRHGRPVGLLYVDLDRFKMVNDTLGHAAGDILLQQVSQRLQRHVRQSDTVARIGGDEFTLVLNELPNSQGAVQVAQKLLEVLKEPFLVRGHELFVSASIGISMYPTDGTTAEDLLHKADNALYRAKAKGKNAYQLYAEPNIVVLNGFTLESQLHEALERGELVLHYQPQIALTSGKVVGLEALLRWEHPELGRLPPARFIPIAEASELIVAIGAWVLREACRQHVTWRQAGYGPFKVTVNISALQFERADFVDLVAQTLEHNSLEPQWLELELTESPLLQTTRDTISKLARLRSLGVRIAVNNFCTGYSSLNLLQRLPINTFNIDRPFVDNIGATRQKTLHQAAVIEAMITLAHSVGMRVVAAGVETDLQLEFLRRVGCDGVQGYLFSRPLPAEEAVLALGTSVGLGSPA